jgi:hypothetical protein
MLHPCRLLRVSHVIGKGDGRGEEADDGRRAEEFGRPLCPTTHVSEWVRCLRLGKAGEAIRNHVTFSFLEVTAPVIGNTAHVIPGNKTGENG